MFFSIIGIREEQHLYTLEMAKKYGRVYGGYCLAYDFLVINEPELIKEVFVKNFDVFPNRLNMYLGASPYINKNLFFMAGNEDWKRIHSTITPTFTSSKLKTMTSKISSISDELIEKAFKFRDERYYNHDTKTRVSKLFKSIKEV